MKASTTLSRICRAIAVALLVMACGEDDGGDTIVTDDGEVLDLTLTIETEQDQMGDFAENAVVVFNGEVWSVGGIMGLPERYSNAVWKSIDGIAWVSVVDGPFEARIGHTLTVFEDRLFLIGGVNEMGEFLSDVWSSIDGESWILETDMPSFLNAAYHDVVVFNDRMYLFSETPGASATLSVWSSSDGSDWELEADAPMSRREEFKALVFEGSLYVLGGFGLSSTAVLNEIWTSTNGNDWTLVETETIFSARHSHTATVYNGKVFVGGGVGASGPEGNLWYSEDMVNWFEHLPFTADIGLFDHAALSFDGKIWFFGGYEGDATSSAITGRIRSILEE